MIKKLLVALFVFFAFSGFAMAAVDINSATVEQLDVLKGIGPAKAQAIVEYRTKNGPFKSVDDLEKVSGIKKKTIDGFRADVTLGGGTTAPAKAEEKAGKGKPAADSKKK